MSIICFNYKIEDGGAVYYIWYAGKLFLIYSNAFRIAWTKYWKSSEGATQRYSSEKVFWKYQQIYRRTPMPKYDFNKVAKQIALWHGSSPVNLLHIFRTPFPENLWTAVSEKLATMAWLWVNSRQTSWDLYYKLGVEIPRWGEWYIFGGIYLMSITFFYIY